MVRIYFDKQIFSYLFNKINEKYAALLEKVYANKDNFLFYYSSAHLQDLTKADREITLRELDFIETIVRDNFITYDASGKYPIAGNIIPKEAFREYKDLEDISTYTEFDVTTLIPEQKLLLQNVSDILQSSRRGELSSSWLSERIPLSEEKTDKELRQLTEVAGDFLQQLTSGTEKYKGIRRSVETDEYLENIFGVKSRDIKSEKLTDNQETREAFFNLITDSLKQVGISNWSNYEYYIMSYSMLDLIGISKEKESKVKFGNMMTDGKHSYFASLCDCFVSHDKGCVDKTRILYKLLNIKTKVYHIDEFIKVFENDINSQCPSIGKYSNDIFNDYYDGEIIEEGSDGKSIHREIKTSKEYFNYFDSLLELRNVDGYSLVLTRKYCSTPLFISANEIKLVVDKLIGIIGDDSCGNSKFDVTGEIDDIVNKKWAGRYWAFTDCEMYLIFPSNEMGLALLIKQIQHPQRR